MSLCICQRSWRLLSHIERVRRSCKALLCVDDSLRTDKRLLLPSGHLDMKSADVVRLFELEQRSMRELVAAMKNLNIDHRPERDLGFPDQLYHSADSEGKADAETVEVTSTTRQHLIPGAEHADTDSKPENHNPEATFSTSNPKGYQNTPLGFMFENCMPHTKKPRPGVMPPKRGWNPPGIIGGFV